MDVVFTRTIYARDQEHKWSCAFDRAAAPAAAAEPKQSLRTRHEIRWVRDALPGNAQSSLLQE
jgi:hypothetical protein